MAAAFNFSSAATFRARSRGPSPATLAGRPVDQVGQFDGLLDQLEGDPGEPDGHDVMSRPGRYAAGLAPLGPDRGEDAPVPGEGRGARQGWSWSCQPPGRWRGVSRWRRSWMRSVASRAAFNAARSDAMPQHSRSTLINYLWAAGRANQSQFQRRKRRSRQDIYYAIFPAPPRSPFGRPRRLLPCYDRAILSQPHQGGWQAYRAPVYVVSLPDALIPRAFRLAAVDLVILDALRDKLGLSSRADALRYAMRRIAEAEKIDITFRKDELTVKRPTAKRRKKAA